MCTYKITGIKESLVYRKQDQGTTDKYRGHQIKMCQREKINKFRRKCDTN